MKNRNYLVPLLFITIFLFSCSPEEDFNYQSDLESSQASWLEFKESSNNSYKYVVSKGSVFTSYGWETTITVLNGVIIERDFKYTSGAEDFIPEDQLEWTENEHQINSLDHQYTSAFYALTLDEVYEKAKREWLIKRKGAISYFESENNGLISICGYSKKGCMDDCFVGVIVKAVEAL